ncbi:hypothetical protein [Flavobacterium sp. FlaQc-50]|uniref:hypothetical protein n=1 Tax=unclassified Flavobacterium TaxID=196869 RepID=UPI003756F288
MLDPNKTYSRTASIVYDENGIQVLKFNSYLPDFTKLSVDAINYMNRYMSASPEKFEIFSQEANKENDQQLQLF